MTAFDQIDSRPLKRLGWHTGGILNQSIDDETQDALKRMRKGRHSVRPGRKIVVVTGWVFAAGYLSVFTVLAYLTRPIADDYKYFWRARDYGVIGAVFEHLNNEQGRYSSSLVVSTGYRLFGLRSVSAVSLIILLFLIISLSMAAYHFLPLDKRYRYHDALLIGAVGATITVLVSPSPFDSFFWLTSAVNYAPAFSLLLVNAVLLDLLLRGSKNRPWRLNLALTILLTGTVFLGQGFNEIVGVAVTGGLAICAILLVARRWWRGVLALVGPLGAAGLGLAITYLTPGATLRREVLESGQDLSQGWSGLVRAWGYITEYLGMGRLIMLCLIAMLLVGFLSSWKGIDRRTGAQWLGVGALLVLSGPGQMWATGLAGAPSARTLTVPLACVVAGFACLGIGLVSFMPNVAEAQANNEPRAAPSVVKRSSSLVFAAILVVATALGGLASAHEMMHLIRAEALRASAVGQRDASVEASLRANSQEVAITPAPLLFAPNEGVDFPFNENPGSRVMFNGYTRYYRFPEDTKVVIVVDQDATYCVDWPTPMYYKALSCSELAVRE